MSADYNKWCKDNNCNHYVEWGFWDTDDRPYPCFSCDLQGQTYNIDAVSNECPFKKEAKKIEQKEDEKMADQYCYICEEHLINRPCVCIKGRVWLCEKCYDNWKEWREQRGSIQAFKKQKEVRNETQKT